MCISVVTSTLCVVVRGDDVMSAIFVGFNFVSCWISTISMETELKKNSARCVECHGCTVVERGKFCFLSHFDGGARKDEICN